MPLFVTWSMTLDAVIGLHEAVQVLSSPIEYQDETVLASIPHVSYGFSPLELAFLFNKKTRLLAKIRIAPEESGFDFGACSSIYSVFEWLLTTHYGSPTTSGSHLNDASKKTTWATPDATISLEQVHIGDYLDKVFIDYLPPVDYAQGKPSSSAEIIDVLAGPADAIIGSIEARLSKHIDVLRRKYAQTSYVDDYGVRKNDKWLNELNYFIGSVLMTPENEVIRNMARSYIDSLVSSSVTGEVESQDYGNCGDLSPTEFETHCADILNSNGWNARTTQASGDQGIDVIASRGSLRVVIQCKLYSSPIGNKAVQEAIAGKIFENADVACVVSNMSYTAAARQLANAAGVVLIHYDDLPRLHEIISTTSEPN